MDLQLAGRSAVVGGGSSGLGRASAEALAAEGARVLLWARNADRLERTALDIRDRTGAEVHTHVADASDPASAEAVTRAATERLGTVDILVLNAGGPPTVDPTATDPEGWRRAFQLLAATPIELATRLLPGMRDRGHGRVVAILSSGVRQPIAELVYSNAGRSALAAWLKTSSRTVAADGVTINGVLPGRIATPRTRELDSGRAERDGTTEDAVRQGHIASIPANRYGEPAELGALVAFLASGAASYITGQLVAVDGGLIAGL
jgi:3-oxoacyl-[acyl-carrier protein] reductase